MGHWISPTATARRTVFKRMEPGLSANQLYTNWNQTNFVATGWSNALVLGAYGIAPWNNFANTYLAATMVRKDFTLSQLPRAPSCMSPARGLVEPHLKWGEGGQRLFHPRMDGLSYAFITGPMM
jgi:hypothetical protein